MSPAIRRMPAAPLAVLTLAAAVLVAPAPAAPAPADTSPLALVPASAPIVVHVRGVEGTKERIVALLKNALPEFAGVAESYLDRAMAGDYTGGRKPAGLAKNGPIFAVFTEMPKPPDEPKMAFLLAITKYEEFRDNVLTEDERKTLKKETAYDAATLDSGETLYFVNKDKFAVVTQAKEVAEAFGRKQKGLDERISKELAAKLLAGDAAVYVDMEAVNKEYGDQIKAAKETIREKGKEAAEAADKSQRASMEMALKMVEPFFQAVTDSRGLLLSFEFRPAGLALHLEAELQPGSASAKALDGNKTATFDGLEKLPRGQMIYLGSQFNKATMRALGGLMQGISGDPDAKEGKAMRAAMDEIADADPGIRLDAYTMPMRGLQVGHYGDPAKAIEGQLKLLQALANGASFGNGQLKEAPKVTRDAQKRDGVSFSRVELTWDIDKMVENAGNGGVALNDDAKKQLAAGFKKLLGDKQVMWIGVDGKAVLQVSAPDWAAAEKMLDDYAKGTDGAGKLAAFRDVRKELPAETTFLAVVDFVRYFGVMLDATKPIFENAMPLPFKLPSAPKNVPATYVGASATLKPDRAGLDLFISAATVHEFFKVYVLPTISGAAS